SPRDFYIIPKIDNAFSKMVISEKNNLRLELYRFDNLDKFLNIINHIRVRDLYAA
ncbi:recombinase, partial [Citrobacter freundii ATCC 8090 = MTCC 1658 = NBRC 12681]